ncbi:hypothetical protein HMSSN036_87950 [Paenibacillus macerans]|nr:hypothetical protein HMSSN036_87950 [Paenibacillus macerans]
MMTQVSEVEILKNYINGEWVESATDRYEDVYNPATNQVIARVPLSTKEEIDHAVEAAAEAFKKLAESGRTSPGSNSVQLSATIDPAQGGTGQADHD